MTGCSWLSGHAPHYPGTAYVLLHSLSYSLMAEIALDCGYPELAERACVSAIRPTVPPNAAGLSLIPQLPARRARSPVRSGRRQDLRKSARAHWNAQGSARTIRSASTINRTTAAAIPHPYMANSSVRLNTAFHSHLLQ